MEPARIPADTSPPTISTLKAHAAPKPQAVVTTVPGWGRPRNACSGQTGARHPPHNSRLGEDSAISAAFGIARHRRRSGQLPPRARISRSSFGNDPNPSRAEVSQAVGSPRGLSVRQRRNPAPETSGIW